MQEDGEFPPYGRVTFALEIFRLGSDDHPIALAYRQAEQPISYCATDQVDFHASMLTESTGSFEGRGVSGPLLDLAGIAWIRAVLVLLLLSALPGCGTLYLAQAAGGQWHVLRARRSIDSVVTDPDTAEPLRERLSEVRAARDFASSGLHLPDNRSYRTYADIKRPYVVWNVVGAPEFSVEPKHWCFPIAGCVAYRGYFSEKRARAFAAQLARQGFDVTVGGVPAYSTLGKFADPVLNTMLRYGDSDLAAIIFHELAHQLLYAKNDSEFNEAFATTVEEEGLQRWLRLRGREQAMRNFLEDSAREHAFIELFARGRGQLAHLYASGIAPAQMRDEKAAMLSQLTADARKLQREQGDEYYESWLSEGLNNAHLASVATYYQCVPGFKRLLAEQGGDLVRFYAAARELAQLPRAARHAKLCGAPIPAGSAGAGREKSSASTQAAPPTSTQRVSPASAQRDQDDRVSAPDLQHQHSGILRPIA
jgi:predicted aminopeptidase